MKFDKNFSIIQIFSLKSLFFMISLENPKAA